MKVKVYLNDWFVNAGIIGFLRILQHNNDKFASENENYIEFDTEDLRNFEKYYFKYFYDKYNVAQRVIERTNTLFEYLEDNIEIQVENKDEEKQRKEKIKSNKKYIKEKFLHIVEISAKTGQGMPDLLEKLRALAFGGAVIDEGLIFSLRQTDCLRRMAAQIDEALAAAQGGITYDAVGVLIDGAVAAAGEMTGESLTEDTVHAIFDRFCVGK